MIRGLLILIVLVAPLLFNTATAQVSPKRGMAYGYHSIADLNAVKPGISWWYNWTNVPDTDIAGAKAAKIDSLLLTGGVLKVQHGKVLNEAEARKICPDATHVLPAFAI